MPAAEPDLTFEVLGDPKPQGSKRAILPKGGMKPVVIESAGVPLKDWRRAMTDAAREARKLWRCEECRAPWAPIHGQCVACGNRTVEPDPLVELETIDAPVAVNLAFRLVRPRQPRHAFPGVAPDVDKLARAALDSLTAARVFRDDSLVVQLHATKVYESPEHPPGLVAKVWRVDP